MKKLSSFFVILLFGVLLVGCSNRVSTPSDQGTTGEGFSKVNQEQGETTEKGGNSAEIPAPGSAPSEGEAADKVALDFDDVKTPVEAMERFTEAATRAPEQKTRDRLFRGLLAWMEENAAGVVPFYGNHLQVAEAVGKEKEYDPRALIEELNTTFLENPERIPDEEFRRVVEAMAENGLALATAEGDVWPVLNYRFLKDRFAQVLSRELRDYLEIRAAFLNIYNEGYVVIPWDQLADNIMQMEEFIKNYPDSPEYEKVKELYQRELNSYLGGTYGDQVQQDLRESYCRFLDRYEGSDTCAIVKEFYHLLEQNDFKKTEQVDDFLKRVKQ